MATQTQTQTQTQTPAPTVNQTPAPTPESVVVSEADVAREMEKALFSYTADDVKTVARVLRRQSLKELGRAIQLANKAKAKVA